MHATAILSEAVREGFEVPLPQPVAREARRALLNVCGTTVGAARSDAVGIVLAAGAAAGAPPQVAVPARSERTDPWHAAVATGLAAHYDDFDDTHLETVIHPGAACLAVLWVTGAETRPPGAAALAAFALGCEAQLRIGAAISPSHYDAGWHITGTCGGFGAAVTAGLLLGLDARGIERALGLVAMRTLGVRDAFGTMSKGFHPGNAAASGMLAARAALAGADGPTGILERAGGVLETLAAESDPARVTRGWGEDWELLANTYKPYPCGIVCHPAIEAAERLHEQLAAGDRAGGLRGVERVEVRCHPLVVDLTGNAEPASGLQARFSTIHGVAAALLDGPVGLEQYADERVVKADVTGLRRRVRLVVDETLGRDAATVEVHRGDGRHLREHVHHARGSLTRPLTDAELESKVRRLTEPVLPGATEALVQAVAALESSPGLEALEAALTPAREPAR